MIRALFLWISFFFTSLNCLAQLKYPVARKVPFDTTVQGIKIADPYFWMSRPVNRSEMLDFTKQQAALALSVLDSIPGMEVLQKEMDEVFLSMQEEIWNTHISGNHLYYFRDIPKEGPTLCRRKGFDAPEEKILRRVTINGQSYSVRKRAYAHHKPLLALMLTQKGEANPQIRIFDLDKKEFLPDSIAPVMFNDSRGVSMAWMPGEDALLYTQSPPTDIHAEKYFNGKIRKHTIGTDQTKDVSVFGIGIHPNINLQPGETPYIYSFPNSPYLIARIRSGSGDNYAFAVHASRLNGANTPWVRLKNYVNLGDGFDASGKWLYAATTGPSRYQVVKINMETGAAPELFLPEQKDVIAGTDTYYRKGIIAGKDKLYVLLRRIGNMQVMQVDLKSKKTSLLPVASGTSISDLMLMNDNDLVFFQSSPLKSASYQVYDHSKGSVRIFPFTKQLFDVSNEIATEVLWIPSRDGKRIPLSVIYSKNIRLKGKNPFLIEGYGNSGMSKDLHFDPSFLSWIKRGGVYAYAHVRGGGELGEDWQLDGQFPHKMNSVNDMVDVARWLQENEYASSKVFVMGGSAGAFLVGNSINQRPDLFAGGIFQAGLPDIALTVDAAASREERSVGPRSTPEGFSSVYNMSALYHIPDNKSLPSMLIIHGATDYILNLHPAARYAATLQEKQKGDSPILFLTDPEGGHNASANEIFYILKYILWLSGHPDFQTTLK